MTYTRRMTVALMNFVGLLPTCLFCPTSRADEMQFSSLTVSYGIIWDSVDPLSGEEVCFPDTDCMLVDNSRIKLKLNVPKDDLRGQPHLTVFCPSSDCSFAQSRATVEVGPKAEFDLFAGQGYTTLEAQPLVKLHPERIGVVVLSVAARTQ